MANVDFRGLRPGKLWPRRSRRVRGGAATDCAGVGFGAIGAGGFLPAEAAGGYKTVASAYFRGRGTCTQYDLGAKTPGPKGDAADPKVILRAKTLGPKGDAYYGS